MVGVVWTDLSSNFAEKVAKPFSIVNALEHLDKLTPEAKEKADEYIRNAPDFVKTPLRAAWSSQMTIDKNY